MFCNRCGATVQPDYNVCPKCGQALTGTVVSASTGRLERHLRTLGTLWIIAGALFLIPSIALLAVGGAARFLIAGSEMGRVLGPVVLSLIGCTLLIVAAGGICVGWGLMQRQPWARVAALVLGVLSVFHPPVGTALGIYTLWVLMSKEAGTDYERITRVA